MHISRRAFLAAAALAAAGGGGAAYRLFSDDGFDPDLEQTAEIARLFDELEPARRIGRVYLSAHPDEADEPALVRLLEAMPGWDRALEASPARLGELARSALARDFERGLTVTVDGWILSRTEARLCALVALG
jgi:hypothetical protein